MKQDMGAFTTGPWEVRPCVDRNGRRASWDICLPSAPESIGVAVVASVYDTEPTARLIAAAPELYEAGQEILDALDDGCDLLRFENKLRAALAKARGRAQTPEVSNGNE